MSIFNEIAKSKQQSNSLGVAGLTSEASSIFISNLNSPCVIVCSSLYEASNMYQSLSSYSNNVLFFPMDDFLTSEAIELNPEFKTTRIETINALSRESSAIVVTNLMGYLRFLPSNSDWNKAIIRLSKNQTIEYDDFIAKLSTIGYERVSLVSSTGEVGVRGFIVDVFPIGYDQPVRIEFFDNLIESIRYFDIETQLSINELGDIEIYPFSEFIYDSSDYTREQKNLQKITDPKNICEYLREPLVIYKDYNLLKVASSKIALDIFEYNSEKKQENTSYMHDFLKFSPKKTIYLLATDNIVKDISFDSVIDFNSIDAERYYGDFEKLNNDIEKYISLNKTIIICMKNSREVNSIIEYLNEIHIVVTNEDSIFVNRVNVLVKEITKGFLIDDYVFLSSYELFDNKERKIAYKNDYRYGSKIRDVNKLELGDYVVHSIHGIGVYNGIRLLTKNGIKKDYIEVLYRGADKLYIPVEKIGMLTKYATKEGSMPKINKLGTTDWIKTKLSVRKRIEDIAGKLLSIYAKREAEEGFAFGPDTEEQTLFDADFSYELTRDQQHSVNQIKHDMEMKRPMDRLLCGDVGFGKTEVAFRAMFKAVSYSKQVMYLCPTTILSNQQYENAKARFKNYPITIALLNRFTKPSTEKKVIEDFKNGKIDILFGTHRILSKDIQPLRLGLLVIDEEQRFGVSHKEKIKEIKANVDVLTLSATPIPRTLQMSMVGIRNLSLIETAPVNRYPISTYVTPYNKQVIKEAIYNEMSRDGQIFILYNRIDDITRKVEEIQSLVKEARITYAHGAMSKIELENKMLRFINHEFDILICTTIIETGIDIPNVNTLIIIDANNFGLSQLYQIRGRVGRSNKIAFAYLMYDERKVLTETAIKRLQTIKDFTHLGSGFKIASRDLSIRGAGDILGSEQAGFIDTIGIELYIKMLNEEVSKIKGESIEEEETIDEKSLIDVETHINPGYVDDNDLQIEIHRLINDIDSRNTLIAKKEILEDRFGKVTREMDIYMHECWFEKMAKTMNIKSVSQTRSTVEVTIPREISCKINGKDLFFEVSDLNMNFKFSYKNGHIIIILPIANLEKHFIYYLVEVLEIVKKLSQAIVN